MIMLDPNSDDCLDKDSDAMADFDTFKTRTLELSNYISEVCHRSQGTRPDICEEGLSQEVQDYFFLRFGHSAIFDYLHSDAKTQRNMDQVVITHFLKKVAGVNWSQELELADIEYNRNIGRIKALIEEEQLGDSLPMQVEKTWKELRRYETEPCVETNALRKVRGLLEEIEKKDTAVTKWELVNQARGILAGIAHAKKTPTLVDTGSSILYWGGHVFVAGLATELVGSLVTGWESLVDLVETVFDP